MLYPNRGFRTLRTARPFSVDLTKRRRWFDETGSEGDDTPPANTDTQPANNGASGSGASDTFTQAQVEKLIDDRLKRDREAQRKKLLEDLGVESEDALKSTLKAQREREESEKSELEKAQAALEAAQKKAAEAEAKAQEAETKRLEDQRNSAVRAALKDKGAVYPDDVMLYIQANKAEALQAVMGEDGTVDSKAVEKLVAEVEKDRKDYFKVGAPGSQSHSGGRTPDAKPKRQDILGSTRRL